MVCFLAFCLFGLCCLVYALYTLGLFSLFNELCLLIKKKNRVDFQRCIHADICFYGRVVALISLLNGGISMRNIPNSSWVKFL